MNCGMKDEMLLAWVDGDLDQAGRARVSEHIVGCVDCHRTIGDLKDVTGALEKWAVPEPNELPTARELLDRAGMPPSAAPGSTGWRDLIRRYGAVAGIALFAAVAGLVILPLYTSPDQQGVNTAAPMEGGSPRAGSDIGGGATATNQATPSGPVAPGQEAATTVNEGVVAPGAKAGEEQPDGTVAPAEVTVTDATVPADGPATERSDPAPAEPPAPPATTQPAGGVPADEVAGYDTDDAKRDDKVGSAAGAGRAAPAAPKSLARSAGRREAGSAVVRRADVAISGGEASEIADRVAAAARAENGTVTKRWARSKENAGDTVTIELSVPADKFEQTIARLRGVGNVQSVRRSAIDLSGRIAEIDGELADERKNEEDSSASRARKQKATSKDSLERERQGLAARAERAFITVTIVGKP